jgi:hypothetical protein
LLRATKLRRDLEDFEVGQMFGGSARVRIDALADTFQAALETSELSLVSANGPSRIRTGTRFNTLLHHVVARPCAARRSGPMARKSNRRALQRGVCIVTVA